PGLVAGKLEELGAHINDVYLAVANSGITKSLSDVQLQSTISNQVASCVAAQSPTVGLTPGTFVSASFNVGSVAICANSVAQVNFASEINNLTKAQADLGVDLALSQFSGEFADSSTALAGFSTRLTKALETVDSQLARIEQQKQRAQRALAKALYAKSTHSEFQDKLKAVLLSRFETSRVRFEEAHKTAQRMAFLAKRAIEMRLGVKLSELTDALPLVSAPASWESTICTSSGIDFASLESGAV